MRIGSIPLGGGHPLVLISGLNVLESEAAAVETAPGLDAPGQLLVALEAAARRELLSRDVALRAVRETLEVLVRLGEIARREDVAAREGGEAEGEREDRCAYGAEDGRHQRFRSPYPR